MSQPVRILLVDDQSLFLEGLKILLSLEKRLDVVGECCDGRKALEACREQRPDVVLMDLNMPIMDGVSATKALKEEMPSIRVLALTTFDDDERVFDALRAGASGYLLKDAPSEQLVEAILAVHRGESFLQPSIASKVLAEFNRLSEPGRSSNRPILREPLSAREEEVLLWLSRGKSNKEIAVELHLAEGTVKNHVSNVLGKLGVMDRTQAALMARDLGLI